MVSNIGIPVLDRQLMMYFILRLKMVYQLEGQVLYQCRDPNANITTSSTSICQNGGRFSLVATPAGGSFTILQGTTEIKNAIDAVLPGNNNTTYIINAGNIPLGNVTFKYKVSQGTGSSDNVICVDSFSRVVDVLPFPNVDINQFDSQVCENERIRLSSIAVPTSGNLSDITYQWFFRDNNVTTAIPNSNSAQILYLMQMLQVNI